MLGGPEAVSLRLVRQDVHVQHETEGAPENSHGGETVHVRIVRDVVQSTDVDEDTRGWAQ